MTDDTAPASDLPAFTKLDIELAAGWMTVWFNEPSIRNPLSSERAAELSTLCAQLRDRRDVRGVVFRGRGGMFCAGGDLKAFQSVFQGEGDPAAVIAMSRGAGALFDAIDSLPQVTVMAVEGAAMAGGLGLACVGDVVVAEKDARFALTETAIGLTPAQIAPFVVRRLGQSAARRLMLLGERLDADQALAIGLADEIAADAVGVDAVLDRLRAQLKRCAPGAVAETKQLILNAPRQTRDQQVQAAAESFARCLMGEEGREGVASFVQKRKPHWASDGEG